jgi:hypothetical protein
MWGPSPEIPQTGSLLAKGELIMHIYVRMHHHCYPYRYYYFIMGLVHDAPAFKCCNNTR